MTTKTLKAPKKVHPGDAFDPAAIASAKKFSISLFRGLGKYDSATCDTLLVAR